MQETDYVAASGTLTFAPHAAPDDRGRRRSTRTAVTEPDETFLVNLSNESSGTMVDDRRRPSR